MSRSKPRGATCSICCWMRARTSTATTGCTSIGRRSWLPMTKQRPDMREALLARGARIGVVEALMAGDDEAVRRMLQRGRAALPPGPNGGSILAFARTPYAIDRSARARRADRHEGSLGNDADGSDEPPRTARPASRRASPQSRCRGAAGSLCACWRQGRYREDARRRSAPHRERRHHPRRRGVQPSRAGAVADRARRESECTVAHRLGRYGAAFRCVRRQSGNGEAAGRSRRRHSRARP